MWRAIATLVVGLALVLVAIGIVFMVGMRTKSPAVLNAVRRFNARADDIRALADPKHKGFDAGDFE